MQYLVYILIVLLVLLLSYFLYYRRSRTKSGKILEIMLEESNARIEDMLSKNLSLKDQNEEMQISLNNYNKEEKKFRNFFENANIGIYRKSLDGKIIMANPALLYILMQTSPEDLAKINPETEDELVLFKKSEFRKELLEKGKVVGKISEFKKFDMTPIYLRETCWLIKNQSGEPVFFDGVIVDFTEQKLTEEMLLEAQKEIKVLSGMLPICNTCKKIRDDSGEWHFMESYIDSHSEAEFSHGICPECAKRLYPDLEI